MAAKKSKGGLASSLAKHLQEQQRLQQKKRKLENKAIHYPSNGKKVKPNRPEAPKAAIPDTTYADKEEEPIDESKVFVPFSKHDRILIIGDGDFSYSLSIVQKKLIVAGNLIATSFDTLEELHQKYGAEAIDANLAKLRDLGVNKIYHGIDGTRLCDTLDIKMGSKRQGSGSGKSIEVLGGLHVNNIIFNFPHVGMQIKDIERNIAKNQSLIANFFKSCKEFYDTLAKQRQVYKGKLPPVERDDDDMFDEYGNMKPFTKQKAVDRNVITITLFNGEPYDSWKVKKIAKDTIKYCVQRSGKLEWQFFEGYTHRRTAGLGDTNKTAATRAARVYKFEKFVYAEKGKDMKKRGRANDSDSDSD